MTVIHFGRMDLAPGVKGVATCDSFLPSDLTGTRTARAGFR